MLFTTGIPAALTLTLDDGAPGFYPRALVYAAGSGSIAATVDLAHVALGRYSAPWTPGAADEYEVLFLVYEDAGHTTLSARYALETELWQSTVLAASGAPSPGEIADGVWDEALAGHAAAGVAGEFLGRMTSARASAIDATATRTALLEKILRNRLELADGDTGNWILYDDDGVTPLLTYSVRDHNGDPIYQQAHIPSRRTRGV